MARKSFKLGSTLGMLLSVLFPAIQAVYSQPAPGIDASLWCTHGHSTVHSHVYAAVLGLPALKRRKRISSDGSRITEPVANAKTNRRNVAGGAPAFVTVTSGVTRFGYCARQNPTRIKVT